MTSRLADAEQAFTTSLQLRESLGDLNGVATSCNNLGHIYQELKDPEKAVLSLQRSLDIYSRSGNQLGRVISLCNLGMAYYLGGRAEDAEIQLREGIVGLRALEVTQILPEALNGLAEVLLAQDRWQEAQAVLTEVHSLLDQDPMQTARYYRLQGWFEVLNTQFSQAKTAWQNALTHLKTEDIQEKTRLYVLLVQWADTVQLQTSCHWQHELDTLQPELQR
jgi:tetratricopeptide (TPR) repeat protein